MEADSQLVLLEKSTNMDEDIFHLSNEKRILLLHGYVYKVCSDVPQDVTTLIVLYYGMEKSSITTIYNPITIKRRARNKQGEGLKVHFDEKVIVYNRPNWININDTDNERSVANRTTFAIYQKCCPYWWSYLEWFCCKCLIGYCPMCCSCLNCGCCCCYCQYGIHLPTL